MTPKRLKASKYKPFSAIMFFLAIKKTLEKRFYIVYNELGELRIVQFDEKTFIFVKCKYV